MLKLTDEQVEQAAREVARTMSNLGYPEALAYASEKHRKEDVFCALRTAAPFLQLLWNEPTAEEVSNIAHAVRMSTKREVFVTTKCIDMLELVGVLREFVRRRNATFLPKLVDPRRAAIVHVLREYPDRAPEIADKILTALDEVPKP